MKNEETTPSPLATLGYKFIPATDTKPKRIRLEDRRFKPPHRIYISWHNPLFESVESDNTHTRVICWAESLGFKVLGFSRDFETITLTEHPTIVLKPTG